VNALNQARRAYAAVATPVRTPRSTEFEAVARITQKMQLAADKGPGGFAALAEALHDNKKLWDIFAIDVADRKNALSPELRARIFYLAQFTHAHTRQVLARKADVAPLLDINKAILRGLRNGGA